MDILVALTQERGRLQQQLKGIEGAIHALNGSHPAAPRAQVASPKGTRRSAKFREYLPLNVSRRTAILKSSRANAS
jgi:hypothetical protein